MDDMIKKMMLLLCFCIIVVFCYGIGIKYCEWISQSRQFNIRTITVEGNVYFSREEILEQSGIKNDQCIWNIDLKGVNKNLAENPFLENIHIYRCFPDKLVISVQEKKPLALLKVNGSFLTVDRTGMVLPSKIGKMYDLPLIAGNFEGRIGVGYKAGGKKLKFSLNLLNMIFNLRPKLYNEISEMVVNNTDEVLFFTTGYGIPVKAGKGKWMYKINCLAEILERLIKDNELDRTKYIDLRYQNQIIVGTRT